MTFENTKETLSDGTKIENRHCRLGGVQYKVTYYNGRVAYVRHYHETRQVWRTLSAREGAMFRKAIHFAGEPE